MLIKSIEDIDKLPPTDFDLHYYKVVFEFSDAKFIWHEDILSKRDVNFLFSGMIKLVPIEKSEGEALLEQFKTNGYTGLIETKKSSEYIYNKWQKFEYSITQEPFLLCDRRQKLEKMTWRTALYLAFHIFYTNAQKCFNLGYYDPYKQIDFITQVGKPYYDIQSYSVLPSGEVTLYTDCGRSFNMQTWNQKVYFLIKKSDAKKGLVSRFLEQEYYVPVECELSSIEEYVNQLRQENINSSFQVSQEFSQKDEHVTCEVHGVSGYNHVYELWSDDFKKFHGVSLNAFNVSGEGMSKFLDLGNGTNTELVYPFVNCPKEYDGCIVSSDGLPSKYFNDKVYDAIPVTCEE